MSHGRCACGYPLLHFEAETGKCQFCQLRDLIELSSTSNDAALVPQKPEKMSDDEYLGIIRKLSDAADES